MQKFEFLRQPLLGELAMSWKEEEEEREKNAIYSGHLRLCQQPTAAHALRLDQFINNISVHFWGNTKLEIIFSLSLLSDFLSLKLYFIIKEIHPIGQSSTSNPRSNTWIFLIKVVEYERKHYLPVLQVPCLWYSLLWSITVCYLQ